MRSIVTPVTDAGALSLPALSFTVTGPAPRSRPSPVITLSAGWVAVSMPDSPSAAIHPTVTSWLCHPSVDVGVRLGGVRSMPIPPTVVDAVLPTPSTTLPPTDWSAPSPVSSTGSVQPATPDWVSAHAKKTVTGPLFQPCALAGVRLPEIVGTALSIHTARLLPVTSSRLPAVSTLQNSMTCLPAEVNANGPA
ncbi:hypothetical protein [Actinokineospora sp. HUAS TT18]|uniref:hypothetical protein n=1 Tax=Actinokineospora sp. HUAS TT18 TaxID=3447451 RepID=UPI003F524B9E